MEKVFVVKRVGKKLMSAEAAVDTAMAEATALLSDMMAARKELEASFLFADGAQAKLVEAVNALTEARSAMVDLHVKLKEAQLRLGVRPSMTIEFGTNHLSVEEAHDAALREAV